MSIDAEDETGKDLVNDNNEIIALLKAIVYLLEVSLSKNTGETVKKFKG